MTPSLLIYKLNLSLLHIPEHLDWFSLILSTVKSYLYLLDAVISYALFWHISSISTIWFQLCLFLRHMVLSCLSFLFLTIKAWFVIDSWAVSNMYQPSVTAEFYALFYNILYLCHAVHVVLHLGSCFLEL